MTEPIRSPPAADGEHDFGTMSAVVGSGDQALENALRFIRTPAQGRGRIGSGKGYGSMRVNHQGPKG